MKQTKILFAIVLLTFTCIAKAGPIIYDNMVALSDINAAFSSDVDASQFIADDFVLQSGATTIADIHWTGAYALDNSPEDDNFTATIYADAGGVPGNIEATFVLGHVGRALTGFKTFDSDIYDYWVDVAPTTLEANTTYWLSIVNDTTNDTNDNWGWSADIILDGNAVLSTDQITWNTFLAEQDFELTTVAVPEPTTLTLLGLSLAGLGRSRRKKI